MPKKQIKNSKKFNEITEPVHVRLEKPITLRKRVLSTTIDITRMMQTYSQLKQIRETKVELISNIGKVYGEIKRFTRKLEDQDLPSLPRYLEEKDEMHGEISVEENKTIEKELPNSEIEKLKAELADIEKKLGKI